MFHTPRLIHENKILVKFSIAMFLLIVTGVFTLGAVQETMKANERVTHTFQVLLKVSSLERNFRSAELMRAAIAMGRGAGWKSTLDTTVQQMGSDHEQLMLLTADNPQQQERLEKLAELLPETPTLGKLMVRIEAVRSLVQEIDDEEGYLLNQRTARLTHRYGVMKWFWALGKLTSFVLLIWCFYEQTKEITRRRIAESTMIQANELLSEQLKRLTNG